MEWMKLRRSNGRNQMESNKNRLPTIYSDHRMPTRKDKLYQLLSLESRDEFI